MKIAIYPGSFDPMTNGHLDILRNGSQIFDKVIIAVSYNHNKKSFLTVDERVDLIKKCVSDFKNVEVDSYEGLTVSYAKKKGATALLRGLRTSQDFEYELQLSQVNNSLNEDIKTVFLTTRPEYSFISSSMVRELLVNKGDITNFVPKAVNEYLIAKNDI